MSGSAWKHASNISVHNIRSNNTGKNLIAINSSGLLIKSYNYGMSWSSGIQVNGSNISSIDANSTLQYIIVGLADNNTRSWRSTDYGATFSEILPEASTYGPNYVASNPTGEWLWWSSGGQFSTNSGATWSGSGMPPCSKIAYSNSGSYVFGLTPNGGGGSSLYISNNFSFTTSGITINKPDNPSQPISMWDIACDSTGQYVVLAGLTDGTWRSSDYGNSWAQISLFGGTSISCDSTGQYLLSGSGALVYFSNNSGSTWDLQNTPNSTNGDNSVHISLGLNFFFSTYPVGLYTSSLPCFLENTKILTNNGYKPIQDLKKGDMVQTFKDGYKPITMIGSKKIYHDANPDRNKDQLYRCSTEKYPELFEDLIITGSHAILVDEFKNEEHKNVYKITQKIYYTDGKLNLLACCDDRATVYEESGHYTIYHLSLKHNRSIGNYGIYANGLLVESCSEKYMKEGSYSLEIKDA